MVDKLYRPRLSIELTEEQQIKLLRLIPWGVKNKLFSIIVDDVIRLMEEHGQRFLAAVLTKAVELENWTSVEIDSKGTKINLKERLWIEFQGTGVSREVFDTLVDSALSKE